MPELETAYKRIAELEAELESIQRIRKFEHGLELTHRRELAGYKVALTDAKEALQWALEHTT